MCLAQGPQRSDAGECRTHGPSVSSQALYHWATALPNSVAGITVSFIYINDCVTCLSQLPDHAKVSDPAEDYKLCLSSVLVLSRVGRTFFKMYMLAMVLRATPWSKSSSDFFDVDDGGCFGCWHVLLVMCFLLLFHNFLSGSSANANECCSPVPYTIHSRLLFLHAERVHVFNNSCCIDAVSPYNMRGSRLTCA